MFVMTESIIKARRTHSFVGATITGKRSYGKSSYALKTAVQLHMHDGYSEDESWNLAVNRDCLFSLNDVIGAIEKYDYRNRAPILIWDDAGVHGNSLVYFSNVHTVSLLKGLLDTVRTSSVSLLLTTPSLSGLLKFLRKYDDYLVQVAKANEEYERVANVYRRITIPSQSRRIRKAWQDRYSCKIPDKYYRMYMNKRDAYKTDFVKELKNKIKSHELKKKALELKNI